MSEPSPKSNAFWSLTSKPAKTRGGRKVRADAVLRNLPAAAQELVISWCEKPSDRDEETGNAIPGTGGNAWAKARLAEVAEQFSLAALRVSERALSDFYSDWYLSRDLERSREREESVLVETGDAKKGREAGEALLLALGLARQDPKLLQVAATMADSRRSLNLMEESGRTKARQKDRQLAQKDEDLKLAQAKFRRDTAELFIKWYSDERAKSIMQSGSTNAQKIDALGREMFGEDWNS